MKTKVAAFSISIDGFGAGPRQDISNPLGVRGTELHTWFFHTEVFNKMTGHTNLIGSSDEGRGVDNNFGLKSFENIGAWMLGRNMFGPVRGPWPDDSWKGWWGEEPPYHTPVFVLTHHARAPLAMKGGTTFYFVTDGAESALQQAKEAAGGKDVRVGGGVSTIRHYLLAGAIDEMHLALSPVLLGEGENLLTGINLHQLGFKIEKTVAGERATHIVIKKC
jgi:dihydrofolate reductase